MLNNRGFILPLLVALILVVGAAGFIVWRSVTTIKHHPTTQLSAVQPSPTTQQQQPLQFWQNPTVSNKLPNCQGNQYLTSPVTATSTLERVIPLGNIAPPGHVYPTDHIYMVLYKQPIPGKAPTVTTQIFAPADVHVIGATSTEYYTNNQLTNTDWEYAYTPCKELTFYNAHIRQLAGDLKQTVDNTVKACNPDSQQEGNQSFKTCSYHFDYAAKAGEQLGSAGGLTDSAGFDWGGFDTRIPKLAYINTQQSSGGNGMVYNMICPLDYYIQPLKTQMYAKLPQRSDPRCGTPMQDKPGTLQGNWHSSDAPASYIDWPQQLAIVHDNTNPSIGVISAGTKLLTTPGALNFTPTHAGTINREPGDITIGSQIYCYQANLPSPNGASISGKILIQLSSATWLKIENQVGNCTAVEKFIKPIQYLR